MANDPTQDPDFLKASPEDQHSYLMSADPDYAKASASDQNAYLNTFSKTNQTLGQVPDAASQAKSSITSAPMKTSLAPEMVRKAGYALPAIGGALGGIAASPGIVTTALGGGLGSMAGETTRENLMHHIFPQEPSPISKEGLEQTGETGALNAGTDLAMGGLAKIPSILDRVETSPSVAIPGTKGTVRFRLRADPSMDEAATSSVQRTLARKAAMDRLSPPSVASAREDAMEGLMRKATREELQRPSITATPGKPTPSGITEPDVYHWQEGAEPQTRGSQAWSKQRVQSPELQRAAEGGDPDAQTVMMRLGKKGIIIPKPSVGSK